MNRNQEQAAKMYPGLRRRIRDEFGSSAFINKFDAYSHLQGREQYYSFVAYVEIFGRTVAGHGRNENEIFDSIVHNYENGYSVSSDHALTALSERAQRPGRELGRWRRWRRLGQ